MFDGAGMARTTEDAGAVLKPVVRMVKTRGRQAWACRAATCAGRSRPTAWLGSTALLTSAAFAALLFGASASQAACYSGPFPATLSGTIEGVCIANTSFDGFLESTGTITTTGISVVNSQIGTASNAGGIVSSGSLSGGISVDAASTINAGHTADSAIVVGGSFTGGVSNAGTLLGFHGILFEAGTITGGATNSGSITATSVGVLVRGSGSTFTGNIANSGTITAGSVGVLVVDASMTGDVINDVGGVISATTGMAVQIIQVPSFAGGVINNGRMVGFDGIVVSQVGVFGGTTGVVNTGNIGATHAGILVGGSSASTPTVTFTGGIRNSGTISAGLGIVLANVGSFSGGINNSGAVLGPSFGTGITLDNVGSLSGNIVNTGTITAGTGIQISAGVNFSGGATIINSGTLTGSAEAIAAGFATGPVSIVQAGGQIIGDITLSPNADTVTVTGGTIAGNIHGAGASNTVTFDLGSGSFAYDAAYRLTGINQLNVNSGTVVLNGTNDATLVAVNGGALQIGDAGHAGATLTSTSGLSVLGTLSGFGTVIGDVGIGPGGVLAPGASATPGTLTITGNLVMASSAAYLVQMSGTNASKTVISGTATLDGTLRLAGTARAGSYTILTASGVSGVFTGISSSVTGVINPRLVYLGNEVDVVFDPAPLLTQGLPRNPRAVGTPLDTILRGGTPLPGPLDTLSSLSGTELANALNTLSGEAGTGAQQGAFQMMTGFLGLMSDPFVEGRFQNDGGALGFADDRTLPGSVASAYAAISKAAPPAARFDQRWRVWAGGYGGGNRTDGDAAVIGSHDLSARAAGFAAGADYRVTPTSTAGFALAGGNSNWSLAQGLGGGRNDAFQAGVHGRTSWGAAYVSASFAAAQHWLSIGRTALAGATLDARYQAQSYGGRLEAGYRLATPVVGVTPYAAVQTQAFSTPGYSERDVTGSGLGLSYAARTAWATRGELGARFDRVSALDPGTMVTLRGKLGYAHDWVGDPTLAATFQALPAASFVVTGAAPARDSLLASSGLEVQFASGWAWAAKFDGEFAAHSRTYTGTGMVRYNW